MNNEVELYHGSDKTFKEFDAVYISQSLYGWGFNFSTNIELAKDYGKKIYTIELPDNAKILDFDNNNIQNELFNKFADDIESHGISKDFINIGKTDGNFKEFYWMLEENYFNLLGLSHVESQKRLTKIVKSFGYIGTKRGSIYVIFDEENMKIKNVRDLEIEENKLDFSSISKKVLNESLSQLVWHFTTLKKYYQMVDSNSIIFSTPYSTDIEINNKYGNGSPYYLSTTRVRDGRIGFSKGKNVRIELNTDFFNGKFKSGAVNFCSFSGNDRNNGLNGNFVKQTENEDRIFSNKQVITGLTRFITRVDIFIPIDLYDFKSTHYDWYLMLRDIYNTEMGLKTFVYNNEQEFNRQGKNITTELLKLL